MARANLFGPIFIPSKTYIHTSKLVLPITLVLKEQYHFTKDLH